MQKNYHTDNKTFMVYKEWEEYLKMLTDKEAGRMFRALFAFAKRSEETEFEGAAAMLFAVMKNCLERDGKKWEDTCAVRSENIKKRWEKADGTENTNEYGCIQKHTNGTDKDKDKAIAIDTDKVKEKEPPKGRRSADKKIINNGNGGHSYDLEKLVEHAMTHTPKLP